MNNNWKRILAWVCIVPMAAVFFVAAGFYVWVLGWLALAIPGTLGALVVFIWGVSWLEDNGFFKNKWK